MGEGNYSVSDIAAVMRNNGNMNDSWAWIILLLLFGEGGFGTNRGRAATNEQVQQGFDTQSILSKLDGITNGLCDGFYSQNAGMKDGFNMVSREVAENRFASQQCCCELKTAIHAEGEATRAMINQNIIQGLRDKLEERNQMLQTANFQISQLNQNAHLVNELRPCAKPAYITCSPYQAQSYCGGCNGY